MTKHKSLLSIQETQKRLGGLGRTRLYGLFGRGQLTARKIGRRTFVEADEVDALIDTLPSAIEAGTIRASSRSTDPSSQ